MKDGAWIVIFIAAVIDIVILVWIMLQIARQTRGIEEIYKLLYSMQRKQNDPIQDDIGKSEEITPPYIQELTERDANKAKTTSTKPHSVGQSILIAISAIGVVFLLLFLISTMF